MSKFCCVDLYFSGEGKTCYCQQVLFMVIMLMIHQQNARYAKWNGQHAFTLLILFMQMMML